MLWKAAWSLSPLTCTHDGVFKQNIYPLKSGTAGTEKGRLSNTKRLCHHNLVSEVTKQGSAK